MRLRPTRGEDLPGLSTLFERRFGHPLSPEEWAWKYGQIPGESRSWVAAMPDGEVVAHAGALCLPARWKAGEAGAWQLVDFAGTTARRGLRSAFVDLGSALLADLPRPGDAPFLFGFPSERHFRLGGKVFGYLPLREIEILGGDLPEGEGAPGAIERHDHSFAGVEAIWEACAVTGVRRSAPFLDWRYYARPNRYYRFYRLWADGEGGEGERREGIALGPRRGKRPGLAVFGFVGQEARAAELWLPPGEGGVEAWEPALQAVAADLREMGMRAWRFWSPPRSEWGGLLAGLGLKPTGERQFLGCRGREGGKDPQAAAEGFACSMGDYDLI